MMLKIELKLDGTTVSGRVLEQDERLRSLKNEAVKILIKNDNFEIRSSTCPQLFFDTLWVRGEQQLADNISFVESYDNPEDANKVYATIVDLVNELNGEIGGVVNEQGLALCIDSSGEVAVPVVFHDWSSPITEDNDQSAKADKGKLELSLVNPELVKAVAEVRMYGTEKYGDSENWRKVKPKRYVDALYRHLLAYIEGNEVDEESGLSHLAHMACNISFLLDKEYLKEHEEK